TFDQRIVFLKDGLSFASSFKIAFFVIMGISLLACGGEESLGWKESLVGASSGSSYIGLEMGQ
ncbi:hypothetical protein HAX54_048257, partial [Datura stramonium]|nr:hypothetical protein [Datura stramonium]